MADLRLKSYVRIKKYRTYKDEVGKIAPNVLERQFDVESPNQKCLTDVTEFNVRGDTPYLSAVLDLYNGEIVAYRMARRPLIDMVGAMLKKAFGRLKQSDKPILHSDQGWQYQMEVYLCPLENRSITQSMSRRGNCYDNAAMESFFGTLKSRVLLPQQIR